MSEPDNIQKPKKKISISSSAYNEEGNVENFYNRIVAVFKTLPNYDFEIIVADNNSSDNTSSLLRQLASSDNRLKVILNSNNFGHLRSPFNALLSTSGDAVITLPSDLQIPPEIIPELLEKWEEGYEVVSSVYGGAKEGIFTALARKTYYHLMKKFSETPHISNFTGSGLYDRKFVEALKKYNEPYPYLRGLVGEIGFRQTKIYCKKENRVSGKTKNNFYTLYDLAITGMLYHSKVPMRITLFAGWIVALGSFLVAIGYLLAKLLFWNFFTIGIAPLIIGMFFLASIQLIAIGIVGEYAIAILTQTKNKPHVIERERINFDDEPNDQ
jgi:polyisoprenyl-phosphate glycosyltransferase